MKFFTTYNLLVNLADQNLKAIGTVYENRSQGANKKLKDAKTITVMMEMFIFVDGITFSC